MCRRKATVIIDGINVTAIAERRELEKKHNTDLAEMMEGLRERQRELIEDLLIRELGDQEEM